MVDPLSTMMIVELTGTWCPSCGDAKDFVEAAIARGPRVHHMAVHKGNDPFVSDRTEDVAEIYFPTPIFPLFRGSVVQSVIDDVLAESPVAQTALNVTKDGSVLKIETKVEVLGEFEEYSPYGCAAIINGQQGVSAEDRNITMGLFLVESGLEYNQAGLGSYTHNNVLRDYITELPQGRAITEFGDSIPTGSTFCEYFEYDLSANNYHTDLSNCKIVAIATFGRLCLETDEQHYNIFLGSDVFDIADL